MTKLLIAMLTGLLAGWLAGLVTRGSGFGLIGNILIALPGASSGVYLSQSLGIGPEQALLGAMVGGLLGAFLTLWIVGKIRS